jgi:lysophospholipase L1-like esterase
MLLALAIVALAALNLVAADLEMLPGEKTFASPGNDARSYERTARGDFARHNFAAEAVVTLNGGGGAGCAFFGLGAGEADPQNYNEPVRQPVVFIRLAPGDFAGGQVMASVNGKDAGMASAPVGDGTHRVKLIWDAAARRALFDVYGKSAVTVDARGVDFGGSGHIFIGGANGVKFSGFSIKPLTDAEIKSAGFGENLAGDPTAGTWLPVRGAARSVIGTNVIEVVGGNDAALLSKRLDELNADIAGKGILSYPGISDKLLTGYAYNQFYDWDLYFENVYLSYYGISDYCFSNLKAFLDRQKPDGFVARSFGPYIWGSTQQFKPFLAQIALLGSHQRHDFSWLKNKYYDQICKYLDRWMRQDKDGNGLPVWDSADASGMDNQNRRAGVVGSFSCEGVDLACYLVREFRAMAIIAGELGNAKDEAAFTGRANALARRINEVCWDDKDGFYYDRNEKTGKLILLKSVSGFMPLWAGVATPERARRLVNGHLLNPKEFWLRFPVATYAKTEPDFYEGQRGKECNWCGPTWIPVNYMIFHGLRRYGFNEAAKELADRTFEMVLRRNAATREFYNSDNGTGNGMNPFWGWSSLGYVMPLEFAANYDPTDLNAPIQPLLSKLGVSFASQVSAATPMSDFSMEQMRPLVCWYDGSKLAASREFANGVLQTAPARWTCDTQAQPVSGDLTTGTWLPPEHWKGGAKFVRRLLTGENVTIVTMGTSLTGGTWRWPDVMMGDWLNKDFPGQVQFFNEGVGASASSVGPGNNPALSGLGKLPAVIAHKPDVVFIEFAMNDAYLPYKISVADCGKNLNTIIDAILAANPRTEIILQTMNMPVGESGAQRPQVNDYNQVYRDVARERGLLLLDHYPKWLKLMTDDRAMFNRLVPDGIHPRAEGYRMVMLPELKARLMTEQVDDRSAKDSVATPVDGFMKPVSGSVRPLACWYDGSKLAASRIFTNGVLQSAATGWTCDPQAQPVAGEPDAHDLTVTFTLADGAAKSAGVAVAFDFARWSTNNYVLIPASVYNGNRNRTVGRGYNEGLDKSDYYRKDLPLTQTAVPRLDTETDVHSKLEVAACNASTPAVCIFDPAKKRGFILLAEQAGRNAAGDFIRKGNGEIMDNAFAVEESADRSHATVVVSAPGVRELKPEFVGFSASPDRGMDWKTGDTVTLHLRVYSFAAADIPALLEKFMSVRKAVTGPNHPRDLAPASQVEQWMTARIDGRFYSSPTAKFYCPENAAWIAFGWVGGWMDTFPMLALGDATHLERVSQTFDYGLKAQEPTGYFHYAIDAKGSVTFRDPAPDMNMARTSGDMLFWMIKQFQLLQAQGRGNAIKPEWEAAMRKLADAMVLTWKKDGQWGKLINVKTGEVGEYNTTGGAMIVGGLALASDYFHQPEYLKVAKAAADYYYQRDFVKQGFTTGACADILQNAESETAAGFMTALMALYETTGDPAWLEKSRNLANLAATWTVSYDYELPKFTELGGLDAKLAGAVWASTQNKHGAPGICTSSGDPLFKIYRATGDRRYAELMRDIIAAHGESIRPGGFTNERLTYCDADSRGSRGTHVTGWNELNGALMALELPGIYLQTDADKFFVFDSVAAKIVKRDAAGVTLAITNPTKFAAQVSIFAERARSARQPLGYVGFLKWPKVEIKAGATVRVRVMADGTIQPTA